MAQLRTCDLLVNSFPLVCRNDLRGLPCLSVDFADRVTSQPAGNQTGLEEASPCEVDVHTVKISEVPGPDETLFRIS